MRFHGSLYEYLRNTITSANDYLVKQSEENIGLPNKPLQLNRNIFGVSVGGPIQKDRLFFFANYEGTREREQQRSERVIPTPQLCQGIFRYNDANGGITTLMPSDLTNLDPKGIGIDPAMLDLTNHTGYLDKTFCTGNTVANDPSAGDSLNYAGFVFRAPTSLDNDVAIARLDYRLTSDGRHTLFLRGASQDLRNPGAPFLPGDIPESTINDHSKGFVLGYISVLTPALTNSFRWGFTRESFGLVGNTDQQWNEFLGLDQGVTFSHSFQVPLNNLVDDVSWTKGTHTFQFGAAIGIARDPRQSYLHSNTIGLGTTNWTSPIGFANTGSALDPANGGAHPNLNVPGSPPGTAPEPLTATQYDRPLLALYGMISDVVANYNLDKTGTAQAQGTPVNRNYGLNWYEFYGQDTWRAKPNLTVTYGLRWSLFPPPWETNGLQTSSTFGLGTQFNKNVANMNQGLGYTSQPPLEFTLGGPLNHGPGFYSFEKTDLSPRLSIAYSPRPEGGLLKKLFGDNDKTVFRVGFSRVYDRAGFALLNSFDQIGAAGLATTLQNACCTAGETSAQDLPRITGINTIPQNNINGFQFLQSAPSGGFPMATRISAWLEAAWRTRSHRILRGRPRTSISLISSTSTGSPNFRSAKDGLSQAMPSGCSNAFIGNWQLSGIARWTSGFPFSVDGGQRWPTDWFLTAVGQMTSRPKTGTFKGNGTVNVFADPAAAQQDFTLPLPGQVGSRNVLRGDGYAGLDMSLVKNWKMPYNEAHIIQFRWEVFNVPNLTRFNAQSIGSSSLLTSLTQQPNNFGAYTSLLTQPRVMQFALRYEF